MGPAAITDMMIFLDALGLVESLAVQPQWVTGSDTLIHPKLNIVSLSFPLLRSIPFRIVVPAARVCPAGVPVTASGGLGGGILGGMVKAQKSTLHSCGRRPSNKKGISRLA
jgi:hypothetical protein